MCGYPALRRPVDTMCPDWLSLRTLRTMLDGARGRSGKALRMLATVSTMVVALTSYGSPLTGGGAGPVARTVSPCPYWRSGAGWRRMWVVDALWRTVLG